MRIVTLKWLSVPGVGEVNGCSAVGEFVACGAVGEFVGGMDDVGSQDPKIVVSEDPNCPPSLTTTLLYTTE